MRTLRYRLSEIRARLSGSPVLKGTLALAGGSIMGRAIGVASMPILTRIYSPEHFGVLAIFSSLIVIITPILTLRYVIALPLPRTRTMAMNLLALSTLLLLGFSAVIGVLLYAFGPSLLALLSMEVLAPWWWLITACLVGAGGFELMSMWATRHRAYAIVARTQVIQSAAGELLKIGLGLLGLKPFGLLFGQFVSYSLGIGSFVRRFADDFRSATSTISMRRMGFLATYYRDYPLFRMPAHFLMSLAAQIPLFFAAAIYDAGTAGQLGLAMLAISLPSLLVAENMGKAFYAEASSAGRRKPKEVEDLLIKSMIHISAISVGPALAIWVLSPYVFPFIFGAKWVDAGRYTSILSLSLISQMASTTSIKVFNVYNKQSMFLKLYAARALGSALVFLAAYQDQMTLAAALYLYVAQMVAIHVYTIAQSLKEVRSYKTNLETP